MTIEQYETLTGQTVSEADTPRVEALILRATSEIESALGYSLTPDSNIYSELGKVQYSWPFPRQTLPPTSEMIENLLPARDPIGEVKVFPLELKDKHALVQPFDTVHRAMIVLVTGKGEFITLVDLTSAIPQYNSSGWGKWIEIDVPYWTADPTVLFEFTSIYGEGHPKQAKFALAVDADWTDVGWLPGIQYLIADMVQYRLDPNNSVAMSNVTSESVDGHSWSKSESSKTPIDSDSSRTMLSLFAGPYGIKRNRVPVK